LSNYYNKSTQQQLNANYYNIEYNNTSSLRIKIFKDKSSCANQYTILREYSICKSYET